MYKQSLTQAGLTEEMAQIYEVLLKNGPQNAGKLAKKTGLKRGLVYKTLDRLLEKGLLEKNEADKKVSLFSANHPLKLQEIVETKQQRAKNAALALDGVLPALVSDYNLLSGKPEVLYFEGEEGLKKIAFDSLSAKTEILQYIDNEAANKYWPNLNEEYVKKRKGLGIKKRMITIDSEFIKKNKAKYDRSITDIHLIDGERYPFATSMQIYDNKVSHVTLSQNKKIGFLIEDAEIAGMHRTIFEYMWEKTSPLFEPQTAAAND
ncbi:MAG: helix-turn-helix domain-containing protein [Patescibacteria group bacterium]